jgi:hypothetical protein
MGGKQEEGTQPGREVREEGRRWDGNVWEESRERRGGL